MVKMEDRDCGRERRPAVTECNLLLAATLMENRYSISTLNISRYNICLVLCYNSSSTCADIVPAYDAHSSHTTRSDLLTITMQMQSQSSEMQGATDLGLTNDLLLQQQRGNLQVIALGRSKRK
jgi:hypothetical protein